MRVKITCIFAGFFGPIAVFSSQLYPFDFNYLPLALIYCLSLVTSLYLVAKARPSLLLRLIFGVVTYSLAFVVIVWCFRWPALFPAKYARQMPVHTLWVLGLLFQYVPIVASLAWLQAKTQLPPDAQL
jgi:hypothetical protein